MFRLRCRQAWGIGLARAHGRSSSWMSLGWCTQCSAAKLALAPAARAPARQWCRGAVPGLLGGRRGWYRFDLDLLVARDGRGVQHLQVDGGLCSGFPSVSCGVSGAPRGSQSGQCCRSSAARARRAPARSSSRRTTGWCRLRPVCRRKAEIQAVPTKARRGTGPRCPQTRRGRRPGRPPGDGLFHGRVRCA